MYLDHNVTPYVVMHLLHRFNLMVARFNAIVTAGIIDSAEMMNINLI